MTHKQRVGAIAPLNPDYSLGFPRSPQEAHNLVLTLREIIESGKDEFASDGAKFSVHEALIEIAEGRALSDVARDYGITYQSMCYTIATRALIPLRYAVRAGLLKERTTAQRIRGITMNESQLAAVSRYVTSTDKPTSRGYSQWRDKTDKTLPSVQTIVRHFGSWSAALLAAGSRQAQSSRYDDDGLLRVFAQWVIKSTDNGRPVSQQDFADFIKRDPMLPSSVRTLTRRLEPVKFVDAIAIVRGIAFGTLNDRRAAKLVKAAKGSSLEEATLLAMRGKVGTGKS